jgi:hypothetical protein
MPTEVETDERFLDQFFGQSRVVDENVRQPN